MANALSPDLATIVAWDSVSAGINRYFSIFIFLFGTVGNVLNIVILSRRPLRTNPCSLYFLVSSIANLIAILAGLTTRMLSGWALDLTNTVSWLCKSRAFVLFVARNIASWLLMLAAVDRWLLSCWTIQRRRLSTLKHAQYGIYMTTILSILIYIPIFYCYETNMINTPLKCYSKTNVCRYANDLTYACITLLLPIQIMLVFGLVTIRNIIQVKRRVQVTSIIELHRAGKTGNTEQFARPAKKKLEYRLFLMLFIQIIMFSVFTLPQAIQKFYSTLVSNDDFTLWRKAIENFLFNLFLLLTYFAQGMPFYIYTLSGGTVFRTALKTLFQTGRT